MKIQALKVQQWLTSWSDMTFDSKKHRAKPDDHFYLFSLDARSLRSLSGIYARSARDRQSSTEDLGIQRRHEEHRSQQINEFVKYGHPWCELSKAQRESDEYDDLRKPGWLPTAIVVNILKEGDIRVGKKIAKQDIIKVSPNSVGANLSLPDVFKAGWRTSSIPPIEVIDGQHRLWAFDEQILNGEFELPVVAFHGLDLSWQAYLFYTINIKPKRINASLAFDLYPMLRTEDWLERFEGPAIYREARAQELVDLLYSTPQSPWYKEINMLGETGTGRAMVSQAAWIRSLMATFIKKWEGPRIRIGGLFGVPVGTKDQALPWGRHEQAAFLILAGDQFKTAVRNTNLKWAKTLRTTNEPDLPGLNYDAAFSGSGTLIAQDQGIRAFLSVINDLCYVEADALRLDEWGTSREASAADEDKIKKAISTLRKTKASEFLSEIAITLAKFDWRSFSASGLTPEESQFKAAYRGSGGYALLRKHLLQHIDKAGGPPAVAAKKAIEKLNYK